jgi:undecaprenyl pyrophosphate synthase
MAEPDGLQPRRSHHVLLIPDGNRRYARREFLRASHREHAALADDETIRVPLADLRSAYRRGFELVDALLRALIAARSLSILSIYAMQPGNLARSDDEVLAFLETETEAQQAWANDAALLAAIRFRRIGDGALLEPARHRPALRSALRAYADSIDRLESVSRGDLLVVNVLAPYDPIWEIARASEGGTFDPLRLAVPEKVDLVIRTGGAARSLASGALPLQSAYSRFAVLEPYFPDCTVDALLALLDTTAGARERRGL